MSLKTFSQSQPRVDIKVCEDATNTCGRRPAGKKSRRTRIHGSCERVLRENDGFVQRSSQERLHNTITAFVLRQTVSRWSMPHNRQRPAGGNSTLTGACHDSCDDARYEMSSDAFVSVSARYIFLPILLSAWVLVRTPDHQRESRCMWNGLFVQPHYCSVTSGNQFFQESVR